MITLKNKYKKRIKKWQKPAIFAVIIAIISIVFWYNLQLAPVGGSADNMVKVVIESGTSPSQIGTQLKDQSVIKSTLAFDIYTRLVGKRNNLQAGVYHLSPSESTRTIVAHLVQGSASTFNLTFYPGAALVDNTDKPAAEKDDVVSILKRAGYSQAEIDFGLNDAYSGPLFAGRPAGASLEGYVYGETYNFNEGSSVSEILQRTFDEFYSVVQSENLVAGFAAQGLNLYQGITLASIIQREVPGAEDQRKVAQVFLTRLDIGMVMGSDVTYQYIADKTGVARDPELDSPYNTRKFGGLPPGPISAPGLSALRAVANPAATDYLYFLSGDDDVTYFAGSFEQHQANISSHCLVKCSIP